MKKSQVICFAACIICTNNAGSNDLEAQMAADCKNISNIAEQGNKLYQSQRYSKARERYEAQAAWSESCQLDNEEVATAYNNVALTYIKQKEYLKAKAWLWLDKNNKKSIYNYRLYQAPIHAAEEHAAKDYSGEYWLYSGQSLWNTFGVKKLGTQYKVEFNGYYAGIMTQYYGPNIGEFSEILDISSGKAVYKTQISEDIPECVITLKFKKNGLTVESTADCGFGHNVNAAGEYVRVQ